MEIELEYNKGKAIMLIDDEDYEFIKKFCINKIEAKLTTNSKTPYAVTRKTISKKRHQYLIHRLIMKVLDNPKIHIDHINGNTLDNRKQNLRFVNRSQNMKNRNSAYNSTSIFLGVHFCKNKKTKRWRAVIKPTNQKNIHLGYYKEEVDAGYAYNVSAKIIHGQYAKINKIDLNLISNKKQIEENVYLILSEKYLKN